MFNMLIGRKLVNNMLGKEKFVMTTPLLADSEGRKIGKTEGNAIALNDKPENIYAKIMAFPDDVLLKAFECVTNIPAVEIEHMEKSIQKGENPMKYKKQLAYKKLKPKRQKKFPLNLTI